MTIHHQDLRDSGPDAVVQAAAKAQRAMALTSPARRAAWLRTLARRLDDERDQLVPMARRETSLTTARLDGEVTRTTNQLGMFADLLEQGGWTQPIIVPADEDAGSPDVRRTVLPLGPVAVFPAGNFPFAFGVTGGDTASALAAGCPVVVKTHPGYEDLSSKVCRLTEDALEEAGAPVGVFGWTTGVESGRELVQHPAIRAVGFTGSTAGGRALMDLVNQRPDPVPFYGELGSVNPVVVAPGAAEARPEDIARGLVESFTMGAGQFCTKPGLVLVPKGSSVGDALAEHVPSGPVQMLSGRIDEGYRDRADGLLGDGRLRPMGPTGRMAEGQSHPLVLIGEVDDFVGPGQLAPLDEECFGPLTVLLEYHDRAQVADLIARAPGSLTVSVQADPQDCAWLEPLVPELMALAGRLVWNGWPTGVAVNAAMHHGGPWPATTNPLHTSVGATAIRRWLRPVAFQDWPDELLPTELRRASSHPGLRWIAGRAVAATNRPDGPVEDGPGNAGTEPTSGNEE